LIVGTRGLVRLLEESDLLTDLELGRKDRDVVEVSLLVQGCGNLYFSAVAGAVRDEGRGARGFQDVLAIEVVGVGVAGFLAGNDSDADAEVYAFCGALDDLLFEDDGVVDAVLEVEIGVITAAGERFAKVGLEVARGDVVFFKENRFG